MTGKCPCREKDCFRPGDGRVCREQHADSKRCCPAESHIRIRPFRNGDEAGMADLVAVTLKVSNRNDYSPEYIEGIIQGHSPGFFSERAADSHFYIACDRERIIGCGGITGYRGSTSESYLISVFVRPEYQGRGIGKRIMEALESDEFFRRAWRTELGASVTAVGFYQEMGYAFKNGVTAPDESGVVKMEKITGQEERDNGRSGS